MKQKILKSPTLYTLLSIALGFLLGAILLFLIGVNPAVAYGKLWNGIFGKPKFVVYSIVYAAPLIFTGLSVAFSFRTGVFNIGAEGQYIMGSLAALVVGLLVPLPRHSTRSCACFRRLLREGSGALSRVFSR